MLSLTDVSKTFHQEGHPVAALRDVSIDVRPGETLGLVGESGSGKTTLARILLGLTAPDAGSSVAARRRPARPARHATLVGQVRAVQIVFQNPDTALNRRFSVRRIIGRAVTKLLHTTGAERDERILHLAREVRFDERLIDVRPGQLSGGLKQRVAIARAFAGEPRLVVCDEPTSALDVSVQAAILNLLADMQSIEGVTYVFISHDLGVVRYLADRIAVLYLGRLMEVGDADRVFEGPHHPYTESLLSAVPTFGGANGPASTWRARSRARYRRRRAASSTRDAPGRSATSASNRSRRCPRPEPGHLMRCHIPIDELRRMQRAAPGRERRTMRTIAAVLPRTGAALEVCDVELEAPHAGEAIVRLEASGVCHSDLNAADGTAETPCPAVLGHEGAGVVESVGEGVALRPGTRVALSWMPSCGRCEECVRDLPHLCRTAWQGMGTGGLVDGTSRLSRGGIAAAPLLLPVHVRASRRGAGRVLRPDPGRRARRGRGDRGMRGLHRPRSRVADGARPARRARRGDRLRRRGALGPVGSIARGRHADRRRGRLGGQARAREATGRHRERRLAGRSGGDRRRRSATPRGAASTTRSRRPAGRRRCRPRSSLPGPAAPRC